MGGAAPGTPLRGEPARRADSTPRADAAAPSGQPAQLDSGRATPAGQSAPLRWQRGELLGTGAFGRVFLGLNEDTGELLAVKEVALSGSTMEKAAEQLRGLEAEVALLRGLSHPNIVRYLGTERTPQARTPAHAVRRKAMAAAVWRTCWPPRAHQACASVALARGAAAARHATRTSANRPHF